MRRILLTAAICIAASTTVSASTRVIPVAGHLPGANGTNWTTDLSLTNQTTTNNVVDLIFRAQDGIARTRSITLGANESVLLEDAVGPSAYPAAGLAGWLGQLEIRSSADVSASAHIFTRAAGGTFGSTYEAFDPAVLSTSGSIAGLIVSSRFRSNVAFANANDVTNAFDYVLRREDGSVAASRHVEVPAHSTRQLSIGDDVAASGDDARLSLAWTATGGGYVVGSVVDNRSGDPTNAQSTSRGATLLSFPVVGRTPGSNSTFWSTSVAVVSTSDDAGTVTFVYGDNGSGQTFTATRNIAAHATVSTDDLNAFVGAPSGTGALKITATVKVAGAVRVFNTQADGSTFGSAIMPQSSVVRATTVRVTGVRRDDQYRLNVAISNDDATTATDGTVRLFDDQGQQVEIERFHVEHGKFTQVPMSGGDQKVHSGEIEVETGNGVPVTVVASNVDNRSGDTLQHEAEQENERQNDVELEISPRTAAVGSTVAFSLKHPASNVASVTWSFGDGTTSTGASATHVYSAAGEYEVNVQVTLTGGSIVRLREDIRVGTGASGVPAPASIDFTFSPAAPMPGQAVVFTATGATSGGTFNWKFPGDVRKSGNVVTFTFANAGSYEVEVELEHEGSSTVQATHLVTVGGGNGAPAPAATSIDFNWSPQPAKAGRAVIFTASLDRQPPSGSIVKWRFPGDSRPEGSTATFTFATAGTYTVRVQLEQPGQASIEREKSVTVSP